MNMPSSKEDITFVKKNTWLHCQAGADTTLLIAKMHGCGMILFTTTKDV